MRYLSGLRPHLETLNSTEFEEVNTLLKPIMHTLLMIWKHSKFYNTPPALALMLRMTCNKIIEQSRDYMGSTEELFNLEPKEAVEKPNLVLSTCKQTKFDYFNYYNISKTQCEANPWMADRGTMFKRLDGFVARCEDLLYLCKTAQQFEKMMTVVIGGVSGAVLTNDVESIAAQAKPRLTSHHITRHHRLTSLLVCSSIRFSIR